MKYSREAMEARAACAKRTRDLAPASEAAFGKRAELNGWYATKVGWPDFLCVNRAGEVMVVEVKASKDIPIPDHQRLAMHLLESHGIACWKWTPDGGMERMKNIKIPTRYAAPMEKRARLRR